MTDAAARIAALESQIAEKDAALRASAEALEPFAHVGDAADERVMSEREAIAGFRREYGKLTVGQFRHARTAAAAARAAAGGTKDG